MIKVYPLTTEEKDSIVLLAQERGGNIENSATTTVTSGTFIFFAAFDGTDNAYVPVNGDTQNTAIGQLRQQVFNNETPTSSFKSGYYPGPGTPTIELSSWFPPNVYDGLICSS